MKAKHDLAVQLATEKARALSEIKVEQQKVRRLNEKVSLFCELNLICYKLNIIQYRYIDLYPRLKHRNHQCYIKNHLEISRIPNLRFISCIQYCAKVMQTNFDEFPGFRRKFARNEISAIFCRIFATPIFQQVFKKSSP